MAVVVGLSACAPGTGPAPTSPTGGEGSIEEGPRLLVFVVVDQLRADLLTRYAGAFGGGFRTVMEEGHVFTQASHRHAGTYTAPGHATLSTGVHPFRHGIVANEWSEQTSNGWRSFYNTFDSASAVVGFDQLEGRSPANLMRPALPDWVRDADADARVVSVSTKDRSAILMGGQRGGEVYWIESVAGGFVTSEYYRDDYPGWVEAVNRNEMRAIHGDSVWTSTVSPAVEGLSRPDPNPFEFDGVHTVFPHDAREEVSDLDTYRFREWVRHTPRLDEGVLELALAAVDELDLGRGPRTDYLAVSFSQVDYVGHRYGPFSREQLDNLLQLDELVGRLIDAVDERVGEGRWVMALTADHGVVELPEWRQEQEQSGYRVSREELRDFRAEMNAVLAAGGEPSTLQERLRERALGADFIEAVYPHAALISGERPDSFAVLFRNSYYPGRSTGLLGRIGLDVRMPEGTVADGSTRGTTHGSPYWYDRHVPLFFLGAGVAPGRSDEPVFTVDIAPTLAWLAGIPMPMDLDGRVLLR